jgi:hypothetical protein
MARRRARRGTAGAWIGTALIVLAAGALGWWWFSTRRAEAPAPPATIPGARALRNPPEVGAITRPEGAGEDISGDDKQALDRVLRERGGAGPR